MSTFTLQAFDSLAGCSLGTWSNRDTVISMLEAVRENRDAINTPDIYPDLENEYRDLAKTDDDDVQPEDYEAFVVDYLDAVLPAYCSLSWVDGEFRVTPFVDDELTKVDELPTDDDGEEINPDGDDHILVVTDHGNVTLFEWETVGIHHWSEVWGMV